MLRKVHPHLRIKDRFAENNSKSSRNKNKIIKGQLEGKCGIDRKKLSWLRNSRKCTGFKLEELIRTTENRDLH